MFPCLKSVATGVQLAILVQPRASKNQLVGLQGEELKVRLTSPPVDGAANKRCIQFFAKLFRLAKSDVELIAGETSRHKRLLLQGVKLEDVKARLAETLRIV